MNYHTLSQAKLINFAIRMGAIKEFKQGMDFTAKTFSGLEEQLANELKELGAEDVVIIKRGVTFRGNEELLYKINYKSRLAIRILKPIGVFNVTDDKQLYDKVRKINWMEVFNLNQTFSVDANLFYSELDHSNYAALKTKDAIVDQFRESTGKRPWVSTDNPDIYIDVHISHNICTISLDSSGESLHKREYRIAADKAPINEVLAAGMISLAGWKGDCDFYDPMCGSATIPMEAAMLAMKIPAGYYRKRFAFMNWDGYNDELWKKIKKEADDEIIEAECSIFASDRSEKAIILAKRNLKHAGLHKDIDIKVAYFDSINPEKGGILIMNPPYGIRMEERGELRDLYRGIGNVLKQNFTGFEAWVISPNIDTAKFIGLRPSKKIALYNGPIETRFLRFDVYEGTKRYGDKPIEESTLSYNDDYQKKGKRSENRRRDSEIRNENYRRSKYPGSEDRKRDYNAKSGDPNPEKRRKVNQERSKNFERHMESLRRFTNSDNKKSDSKKKGRKRITVKKPPKGDQ